LIWLVLYAWQPFSLYGSPASPCLLPIILTSLLPSVVMSIMFPQSLATTASLPPHGDCCSAQLCSSPLPIGFPSLRVAPLFLWMLLEIIVLHDSSCFFLKPLFPLPSLFGIPRNGVLARDHSCALFNSYFLGLLRMGFNSSPWAGELYTPTARLPPSIVPPLSCLLVISTLTALRGPVAVHFFPFPRLALPFSFRDTTSPLFPERCFFFRTP